MIQKTSKETHIFEWVAIYKGKRNAETLLYQFDEDSEYYNKADGEIPFVPVVMNILNKEERLQSFHLIPKDQALSLETLPRFTVDLVENNSQINGQIVELLPANVEYHNTRLIYYFSSVVVYASGDDGKPDLSKEIDRYVRLYKLGLQANDPDGNNYQGMMVWNIETEGIHIQEKR